MPAEYKGLASAPQQPFAGPSAVPAGGYHTDVPLPCRNGAQGGQFQALGPYPGIGAAGGSPEALRLMVQGACIAPG